MCTFRRLMSEKQHGRLCRIFSPACRHPTNYLSLTFRPACASNSFFRTVQPYEPQSHLLRRVRRLPCSAQLNHTQKTSTSVFVFVEFLLSLDGNLQIIFTCVCVCSAFFCQIGAILKITFRYWLACASSCFVRSLSHYKLQFHFRRLVRCLLSSVGL